MPGRIKTAPAPRLTANRNERRTDRQSQRGPIFRRALAAMLVPAIWLGCLSAAFAKDTPHAVIDIAPVGPSIFGTQLTFYGIVSSPTLGGPVPTGAITFAYRDGTNNNHDFCTVAIDTNFTVQSCQTQAGTYAPTGTDRFILIYSGDVNYDGDATGALAEEDYVVTKQTPTISLDPPATVFVGQYAALNLLIGNATQTQGNFGAEIGGDNGTCSIAFPGLICAAGKTRFAGTFDVNAGFVGDANHNAVPSARVGQITILPAPTTLTIAPPAPINLGDTAPIGITLKSVVDPDATFSGDINLTDGEVSCQIHFSIPSSGDTGCTLKPVSAGIRHLTATYSGSADASASTATADLTVVGPKTDGVCGSDNGKTLASPPINLCSAGTASAVAGSGPWTWSCAGSNGGATANCSADIVPTTSYTITATSNPAGSGTVTCAPNPVAFGGNSTCTATAGSGYAFDTFTGDCSGATCTLSNVVANKTVIANFSTTTQRAGTISVRGIANGDTTPSAADGTDFGSTPVGTPVTHGFIIDNTGAREASTPPRAQPSGTTQATPQADGDLIVTAVTSSNPAFTVSGGVGTISVLTDTTFNVSFDAATAGAQTATIAIASNDPRTPTYTFVVSAVATTTTGSGGLVSAPSLSGWMLGLLGALLIGIACARSRDLKRGIRS